MTIQRELERERNKLLLLMSDAHIEHVQYGHSIGTQKDCDLCHIYNQIQQSDELIIKKLQLIKEDSQLIGEFKELRRRLGRLPVETEFKKAIEVKERFGSWSNFIHVSLK